MTTRRIVVLLALVGVLNVAACDSETTGGATTTSVESSTSEATTVPSTIAPTTTAAPTTIAPTTTVPGELFFVDGKLLGLNTFTSMPDAVAILGIAPIAIPASDFTSTAWACRSGLPAWRIQNGTWEMIFEGDSEAQAVLSDWRYQGGPIAGYTGIVAPFGVHVGDSRADVQAVLGSYSDSSDIGSGDIYVYGSPVGPSGLRFEIPGATVVSFGVIDCQVGEGS